MILAEKLGVRFPFSGHSVASVPFADRAERVVYDLSGKPRELIALGDVSFRLEDGDRLAVVGSNGSGKTTLLRVLSGILPPSEGRVVSDGVVTSLVNLNVGMDPEATGWENIRLRSMVMGRPMLELGVIEREVADFSGIEEYLGLPVKNLSSGMRMRLNFAIATSFTPDILILDEWLSTGDFAFRKKAKLRMSELVENSGIIILASHNKKLLSEVCSKAIVLHEGRVLFFGECEDVIDKYFEG